MKSSNVASKATTERYQRILLELLKQPGNDICADCRTRLPRWASWNLGIFICVKCAGIHRKLGTHITKVKSLTLDSWTKEQVESMKQLGNIKSNQIYNPIEADHPPPADLADAERDSQLARYIQMKYSSKSFAAPSRRNQSIDSCSTSASNGVSFTMSNSPTHSPTNSVHQQLSSKSIPLPFQSPYTPATTRPSSQTSCSQERSETAGVNWPAAQKAQLDAYFQGSPMASHVFKSPAPPLRASTAPIPSDGPIHSSSIPLPTTSRLGHNSVHDIVPITQPRRQESLPSLAPIFQPSLKNTNGSQPVHINHNVIPPAPRRDGVWGDLMQLAEPSNPTVNETMPGLHSSTTTPGWSSVSHNATNPHQQSLNTFTFSSKMNAIGNKTGELMNVSSITQVDPTINKSGPLSQHVGYNNPFSNPIRQVDPTHDAFQSLPGVHPNTPALNSISGSVRSSSQPRNPFTNPQLVSMDPNSSSLHSNSQQFDLSSTYLNRNPFLKPSNLNLNSNTSTLNQIGNHFSSNYQNTQLSTLSMNHHPNPFF